MANKKAEERFIKNGSILLEKLIRSWNGRCSPIRNFSAKELQQATNNYSPVNIFIDHGQFKWYKGSIDGRIVSIKKRKDNLQGFDINLVINDIVTAAQMNTHNNILKLVGYCLETDIPIAVYEFAENGDLCSHIHVSDVTPPPQPFLWKTRLRVATEIASAVAYLHTAFPRPMIHRHIKSSNVFLDRYNAAKLLGFELSIAIPEGKTHVEDLVMGTTGYISPEYFQTRLVTEKNDVYSFGVLLMELLTGRKPLEDDIYVVQYFKTPMSSNEYNQVLDPAILEEVGRIDDVQQQVQAVSGLALRCTELNMEERPTMVDVARQLLHLRRTAVDHIQ